MTVPRRTILLGDATTRLAQFPEASVDCVITSPPYFRLRDYQVDGQLGLEAHVDQWVTELMRALDEVARVLVPTGSLWLNLGDSYSTHAREGADRKSFLLGPERLALALSKRGWLIRNKIVWAKPNTTPTSVRDRLATKHEVIYLLTRSPTYFFDLDAIREPHCSARTRGRLEASDTPRTARPQWLGPNSDGDSGLRAMHRAGIVGHPLGKNPGDVWHIPVSTFRGAHFATYPERLVERMLLAGCPEQRCTGCHKPWTRELRRQGAKAERLRLAPTCECVLPAEPGLVLDPFMGAGTTALVAQRHGRDWLGIELNPTFRRMALDRLHAARSSSAEHAA